MAFKKFRNNKREAITIKETDNIHGNPSKGSMSGSSQYLNRIAFKDLSYSKPITVQANPNVEASTGARPYPIINATNQVFETNYPGTNNLAGNTIPLLLNSQNSQLLKIYDCGKMNLYVNYLYAAIKPTDRNQAINVQLGKSVSEAISKAYSETYITMPFFVDTIDCDMENCDSNKYTQALIWYQTMLQNIASVPAKYNMLMSLQQHLKDMSYNRDVMPLEDLFGLLKKSSFKAKLTAFSNIITGEYFDLEWFKQMNTLTMVPSRKSFSMRDPLLVIDASTNIPTGFKITANGSDTPYIKSADFNVTHDGETLSFQDAIDKLIDYLSPYNILSWARQYTNGLVSKTPTDYFNDIVTRVEEIRNVLMQFPSKVQEIRAALEVANRVGMNNWTKGVYFDLTYDINYSPVFNKLCNDVFVNYLASPSYVDFDDITQRWKFYSLWDEYLGIPKYDQYTGGAFLTFSTRDFSPHVISQLTSNLIKPTDTLLLVPKLFSVDADKAVSFVNREGSVVSLTFTNLDNSALASNKVYARINALKRSDFVQRIPKLTIGTNVGNAVAEHISAAGCILLRLFGIGTVYNEADQSEDYNLNSEIICAVDIEIDDISNAMIAYAQNYAPFKVYNPIKTRTVGFNSDGLVK